MWASSYSTGASHAYSGEVNLDYVTRLTVAADDDGFYVEGRSYIGGTDSGNQIVWRLSEQSVATVAEVQAQIRDIILDRI